jgi:hypothetical protein
MIVRILGEGQVEVPTDRLDELNEHDERLVAAVDAGDEGAYAEALDALLTGIRSEGRPVPDDYLGPSDLVLPGPGTSLAEVRELLSDEGLIPG